MSYFYLKQNDRLPSIESQALYADNTPVNITGGTVRFLMRNLDNVLKVDAAGSIVDAALGKMKYDWTAADTDTVGEYRCEFKVTIAGKPLSVPNQSFTNVMISDGLDT